MQQLHAVLASAHGEVHEEPKFGCHTLQGANKVKQCFQSCVNTVWIMCMPFRLPFPADQMSCVLFHLHCQGACIVCHARQSAAAAYTFGATYTILGQTESQVNAAHKQSFVPGMKAR